MDCFVASLLAMKWIQFRLLAAHFARGFASSFAPLRNRGRREDRVLAAPAVSSAICANKTAHEHTGQREHSGLPCAMALRLTSCSSRRTALFPPAPREPSLNPMGPIRTRKLSASTAAPEPHDFTVRLSHTRQSRLWRQLHLTARYLLCPTQLHSRETRA